LRELRTIKNVSVVWSWLAAISVEGVLLLFVLFATPVRRINRNARRAD
jgi:hypothetical protein